jgi:hypothetical protein
VPRFRNVRNSRGCAFQSRAESTGFQPVVGSTCIDNYLQGRTG